jgi:hypothetical protein
MLIFGFEILVAVTMKSGVFCVIWRDASVSEEHIASIFRGKEQAKQESSRSWQVEQTAQGKSGLI